MKILYYIHSLIVGGAETLVSRYALEMRQHGIEIAFVVNDYVDSVLERNLQANGFRIVSLFPDVRIHFLQRVNHRLYPIYHGLENRWKAIITREQPDIIHIHAINLNFYYIADYLPFRLVHTFHGSVNSCMRRWHQVTFKRIRNYADCGMTFFSLNEHMSDDIRNIFHTERIVYMPNGTNFEEIRRKKHDRRIFLQSLSIPVNSFVLGHVARFQPVKNQRRTVSIFNLLHEQRPNSYLLFVGLEDGSYSKEVRKVVHELGLERYVIFLGLREDATSIMAILDAMLLPSFSETFSLVMVEAQAHGIRSVASMAVPEEVVCNDNAFRLSLGAPDEVWAEYLLGDFIERHVYSLEDFAMDKIINRMIGAYDNIMTVSRST